MNILSPETYLSPLLTSYLSKYVKDIEKNNFQLSVWGGDVVLQNLEFKLDTLDNELGQLPFSFVSCQAKELCIHVPWNKITSEPITVTLESLECVLKLNCRKTLKVKKEKPLSNSADSSNQQSYINSIIRKIKCNINIIVNNLTIKYVEEDLVLSINIHSVLYKGVDELWKPSFIEMKEEDSSMRYACEVKDMTICLDKRESDGNTRIFEKPLVFRFFVLKQFVDQVV